MKVLVPVKRVVDYNVKVRVKSDNTGVELANIKMSMNPFDEIAVEEAIRLKEKGIATEVVVVSIGVQQCTETLRTALAMGADRGILVQTDVTTESLAVAKVLAGIVAEEAPGLVIVLWSVLAGVGFATAARRLGSPAGRADLIVAGLLGWAQGTFASKLDPQGETVNVTREIDGGLETVALKMPAIVTTDLRLNEPRYASLPNIMKAKSKPIANKTPADYGVDMTPRLTTLKVTEPAKRQAGIKVKSVDELVAKLKEMGAVA